MSTSPNVEVEPSGTTSYVVGPTQGDSFWQPVPANGFVRNILNQTATGGAANFSLGTQTVAPGCFIREHTHADNEEVIFVLAGSGIARLEGVDHAIEVGSAVYVARNHRHHFLNPHDTPMTFLWLMMPGGLDRFFAEIGRPRTQNQPTPAPFPRPENIAEIERRTVFGWTDPSFNNQRP
jgi:quercetin dioxygenase-like cupin family protein